MSNESSIELKPYQKRVLEDLEFMPSIALFLGTGSGKTYTSLFRVKENGTNNLLVICPARVVEQWEDNIPDVLPDYKIFEFPKRASAKVKNKKLEDLKGGKNVIVISLEVVHKMSELDEIINDDWTIIVDESHKIKELGTRRSPVKVTNKVLKLGQYTPYKIILTATPTQKEYGGYIDYYTQLKFLDCMPMSRSDFEDKYCKIKNIPIPGRPYPIKKIVGYKNTQEIDNILGLVARRYVPQFTDGEPVMIKVAIDKAPSYEKFVRQREYKELNVQNISAMRIAKKTLVGGIIGGRDIFDKPVKYQDNTKKKDWIKGFLEDTDETIVIFYKYNVELEQLKSVCEELGKTHIVINGANHNKRHDINRDDYKVVLGQINACGESIDGLQYKSHIVIYYAMPESSLEYVQSLGRIDRVGQEHLPTYYHLVMKGTIDEAIYKMTLNKIEFTEEVLNKLDIEMEGE